MSVKLIAITPDAEKTMAYIARVSSPNQDNPEIAGLIAYCVRKSHWSVLEHAFMTVEVRTSRMVSAQMIRHRSFTWSEFSQRYAEPVGYVIGEARVQAEKNRQSSIDAAPQHLKVWWESVQRELWEKSTQAYQDAIDFGLARECARTVLPMGTTTRLYMTGSCRSFLHYIQLRTQPDTQQEHREIAEAIKAIFVERFPTVSEALGWTNKHY